MIGKIQASLALGPVEGAASAAPVLRRPRVVLVQTQAEGAGAQEIARILGQGLTARGYDVHHVFFFRRTAAFDAQPNTHFCMQERPSGVFSMLRMLRDLVGHLRALRPDTVLTFQHYGNLFGAMAARLAGAHVVANRVSARGVEPRWTQVTDFIFGLTGIFDRVVVNSKAVADEYASFPARYRKRVDRVDHGFEPKQSNASREQARKSFGLPIGAQLIGSVARLHHQKNLSAAIRLLPLRPQWHLAIAGQGPEYESLESLARTLNVSQRVHFTGELSPERVALFLKSLDVFVFPTRMETFGLAVVEAAQAGAPVVASDIEVLREVLAVDGEPCALFVDPEDTAAFAEAVDRLMADHGLSAELIARSRGLKDRYALDTMADRYVDIIRALPRGESISVSP